MARVEDTAVLENPDNVTVAPWGDVYTAEDGGSTNQLRILEMDGRISGFARNVLSGNELAGVCFSSDGKVLFANLQADHVTLLVNGLFPGDSGLLPLSPALLSGRLHPDDSTVEMANYDSYRSNIGCGLGIVAAGAWKSLGCSVRSTLRRVCRCP